MKCNDKNIKDLLPLYLEQTLEEGGRERVEAHLASCEDCRTECSLLKMTSEEAVPDPGEAFWATMPKRIEREILRLKEKKNVALTDVLNRLAFPRWAWATAVVGILAIALWLLVRPAPVNLVRTTGPENGAAFEEVAPGETINVAELSSTELNAAVQWAQSQLAPIREAVSDDISDNPERDISEDLSGLTRQELDRMYELLKKKEQDIQNRLLKKVTNEKGLG